MWLSSHSGISEVTFDKIIWIPLLPHLNTKFISGSDMENRYQLYLEDKIV